MEINGILEYRIIKNKGIILKFKISNTDTLRRYYEKILIEQKNSHFISEFFLEYQKTYYIVEISSDCEFINVLIPDSGTVSRKENRDIAEEIVLLSIITIYMKNYGIPEQRQLQALHNFKIGNMQNSILQTYMLNGNYIQPIYTDFQMNRLYNESLRTNSSQYTSLSRCLNEKNIFFIQGPPGTGKTTVIRELIAQTILKNCDSKILIVSQANVAVDNVIK